MKGDKVYILIEEYICDYEQECRTAVFAEKQDAYDRLAEVKEKEMTDSWIRKYDEEDLVIGCDDYDCFDIYLDGYASQYETTLRVDEKAVR